MSDYNYLNNTAADIRLIGFPNLLSSFSSHNSAPRTSMFNHHVPQAMILNTPEFSKTFTGVEEKFLDYTFNSSRRETDCQILYVIPKYLPPIVQNTWEDCPEIYVIVLTQEGPGKKSYLDYFTIKNYFMGNNGFGWIPTRRNVSSFLRPGQYLNKETIIAHSPSLVGDNQYALGTNLNVVLGSFAETIEDAFIISQSAAEKLQTTAVHKVVLNCRTDRQPLNLNGTEFTEKFLPDIGSYVRDDGALCAMRPMHWTTCIADGDARALREPLVAQDEITYVPAGAKIIDKTYNINRAKLNNGYKQALRYMIDNTTCWRSIYSAYQEYGKKYELTSKMSTLVRTAMYRIAAQSGNVASFGGNFSREKLRNIELEGINKQMVDFLQVEVTYTIPRYVSNGSKLTDSAGSKGVVAHVYPDDAMPVDDYGIRADVWIDMNSPVARNNPGQLYEMGINRISEFVRRECQRVYTVQGVDAAFDTLTDWYNDVNPNYAKRVRETFIATQHKKNLVEETIATSPKIWIPPFLDTLSPRSGNHWYALENIKRWQVKWKVEATPVTYKSLQADGTYKAFRTEAKFHIGSKYWYHLHKIPEIAAPGPASVNHIGIPTKSSQEDKYFPVVKNPYRFGEDEQRVMAIDSPVQEVVRFANLYSNSPVGVIASIKTLLTSERPSRIQRIPISNGDLLETSAVLRLFHNISASMGMETKNTKIDEQTATMMVSGLADDAIYNADIVDSRKNPIAMLDESGNGKRPSRKKTKATKVTVEPDAVDEMVDLDDPDPGEDPAE